MDFCCSSLMFGMTTFLPSQRGTDGKNAEEGEGGGGGWVEGPVMVQGPIKENFKNLNLQFRHNRKRLFKIHFLVQEKYKTF